MNLDQFEQIKELISETIQLKVNGKIDKISQKLDDYIISDNLWKDDAQPLLDIMKSTKLGTKFLVGVIGFLAAVGTILQVFKIKP